MISFDLIKICLAKETDVSAKWCSWLNDPEVTKYSRQKEKTHTIETQKIFVKNKIKKKNNKLFCIFYKHEHVGVIELNNIDLENLSCEVMYLIGEKRLWGKGLGTYIVNYVAKYAFENLELDFIYAGTEYNNYSSQKVLLNNKFKMFDDEDRNIKSNDGKKMFILYKKNFVNKSIKSNNNHTNKK